MSSEENHAMATGHNRREILQAGLTGFLGFVPLALFSSPVQAAGRMAMPKGSAFNVAFANQHTGETFSGTYRVGNKYLPGAFERINVVLRDFRTNEVYPIDPRVMDILYMVQRRTGTRQPFEVLSGYRSPRTNAMLQRTTTGVARNSLHLTGQAIDVRMMGYSTRRLRDAAIGLRAGGVGYYPDSNFVHMDTGSIRHW